MCEGADKGVCEGVINQRTLDEAQTHAGARARGVARAHGLRPWASMSRCALMKTLVLLSALMVAGAQGQDTAEVYSPDASEAPAVSTPAVESEATAQPGADDSQILDELGGDDYRARQSTTHALLANEALTQDDLDRLYAQSQTPEQRHRLLRVARHHAIRRMIRQRYTDQDGPGSMGLSHQVIPRKQALSEDQAGVLVVLTLPGFPAYALLEPGDLLIDFAGQPFPDPLTPAGFQELIRGHKGGETIDLTVLRDGQTLDIRFRLEQGQALAEVYDTTGMTLKPPYLGQWLKARQRMEALVTEPPQEPGQAQEQADAPPQ